MISSNTVKQPSVSSSGVLGSGVLSSGLDPAASGPLLPVLDSVPEMEVVVECVRVSLGTAETPRLESLLTADINKSDLDWACVFEMAAAHKVSLMLHPALKKCGAGFIPVSVMGQFRADAADTVLQGMVLTGELVALLALFEAEGIRALPFKGPAVAYSLYGGLALRGFGDLDILVQDTDISRATALLVAHGYQAPDQIADTASRPFLQFQPFLESPQSQRVFNFYRADGKVVELHWRFTPRHFPFPLVETGLWNRLGSVDLPGRKALNLAPEDMLLLLCVHGSKHCWERLIWICDIAALISAEPDLDWDGALRRARQLRVARMVFVGLLLAGEVLQAAVPEGPLKAAKRDREAVRLAAWVGRRLRQKPLDPLGETEEYRFVYTVREGKWDRLHYFRHLLLTPAEEDWEFLPLPGFLAPLYYLLRPVRLGLGFVQRRLFRKTAAREASGSPEQDGSLS